MASATLSILGLYRWAENHEIDLFEDLTPPATVEKDVLVNNIIMQAAPFEILYPDPEVLKDAIGSWSDTSRDKWERWSDAWTKAAEFNPLENFDRTEDEEIQHSGTDTSASEQTRDLSGTDNRTQNLTDAETRNLTDTENRSHSEELKISAYDSSVYQPKEQRSASDTLNAGHTGTDNITHTGTDNRSTTDTGNVSDEGSFTHGHKVSRSARYHGNIGVTSLAQLLSSYDEAAENWDLYAKITQDFIKEFCIMVY